MSGLFAEVILPLALPGRYTYAIPDEIKDQILPGQRAVVQFGKNKVYSALVVKIHSQSPTAYKPKAISYLLDEKPIVNAQQLLLWEWITEYYMAHPGDVMNAALPSVFKIQSETKVTANLSFDKTSVSILQEEQTILDALESRKVLTLEDLSQIIDKKQIHRLIRSMFEKKALIISEEFQETYKPLIKKYIRLSSPYEKEDALKKAFESLEKKSPKQSDLLSGFLTHFYYKKNYSSSPGAEKSTLLAKTGSKDNALKALNEKGILEIRETHSGRFDTIGDKDLVLPVLSSHQEAAYQKIKTEFQEKNVVLLHGITSSGKTEIYIHLIEEALQKGKQVLFLLPEIALTTQMIERVRKYFGDKTGVYHSRMNENERADIWKNLLRQQGKMEEGKNNIQIVLGARSSVFLPFHKLGLVIVDEEHEGSYKQYDPSPRYHARDLAIYLSHLHQAKTILGSATPAIESYFNAKTGKYGFVKLGERFGGGFLPTIEVVNITEEVKKKTMKQPFTSVLLKDIQLALEKKEQIILFQNRRGFAPYLECNSCAWVPQCVNCDVSLTYHKFHSALKCHYCGYTAETPPCCPACGDIDVKMRGFGTEKIEEEIAIYFPEARIARMDLDSTRAKNAFQKIINDFEEQRVDILIGTQMVTKGLDFANVSTVGILNADKMLSYPDFRAFERSFQMMAQVSGRAGRKSKNGKVIIQTHHPEQALIQFVKHNQYEEMYASELEERKKFKYPPYYRLIELSLLHKEIGQLNKAATQLSQALISKLGARVLGPVFPLIPRVRNKYIQHIIIKSEKEASHQTVKKIIQEAVLHFYGTKENRQVQIKFDVDPA